MKSCPYSTDCYGFSLFETKTKEADTQVEERMRERMEDTHTHTHHDTHTDTHTDTHAPHFVKELSSMQLGDQ
jgi:ABC-type nickel/cobalt efflux system permease component RcnA